MMSSSTQSTIKTLNTKNILEVNAPFSTNMTESQNLKPNVIAYLISFEFQLQRVWSHRNKNIAVKKWLGEQKQWTRELIRLVDRLVDIGKITNNYFIYCIALLERCKKNRKMLNIGDTLQLFSGVMFVTQKIVTDGQYWFLDEFTEITETDQNFLASFESYFLDSLNFKVRIPLKEFVKTVKKIEKLDTSIIP